jgi:Bifunctional DNA primase/polymerase, N-terminal
VTTPAVRALRAAALAYAARGWYVLPLLPGEKRPAFPDHPADRCTVTDPRCRTAGRHVSWEARATTDPDRITRAWSSSTPGGPYGVGIACGPSGLVVVDLDTPKQGQTQPPPAWRLPGIVDGADVLSHLALARQAARPRGTATRWFPCSLWFARRRRSPTVSLRHRHEYAADLPHGLRAH